MLQFISYETAVPSFRVLFIFAILHVTAHSSNAQSSGKFKHLFTQNVNTMATTFEKYLKTEFKRNIDDKHCKDYTNKFSVKTEEVAFTIHLPFEQLKSWHDNKKLLVCTSTKRFYR